MLAWLYYVIRKDVRNCAQTQKIPSHMISFILNAQSRQNIETKNSSGMTELNGTGTIAKRYKVSSTGSVSN